ncbi:hypothetical protein Taro_014342 [Colocasia esculenta]|uniref:Chlororespiratory reduction 4 n=1 Tax=Colocasia esculenta TaxID=4460 RepID=A0A843UEG3_COLES|nr:hypothetical protein [Colocasia esculenta]
MPRGAPPPNCRSLLHCHYQTLNHLQQLHAQAITQGLLSCHQPLSCRLLNAYARFGRSADARRLYGQIPFPDLVSRTSLLSLLLQDNRPWEAAHVFSQILLCGMKPDGFSVVGALSACAQMGDAALGRAVHGLIYRHGLGVETVVSNALIEMYCRNGRIGNARQVFDAMPMRDGASWSSMLNGCAKQQGLWVAHRLFDAMPEKDVVSWTVMIGAYVRGGHPVRALELFHKMNLEACRPTSITVVGVLSACADAGALDVGCSVHGLISKTMPNLDVAIHNALIDMYSKSGSLETADAIFNRMRYKDVYTWTTIISGLAVNGEGHQALEVFSDMLRSGTCPNDVTFVSVLSACSHSGLIHEGRLWFDVMCTHYNFKPQIRHVGCMVDLLSRAGLLSDATDLIDRMGIEADAVIWRSLLSACLVHGDAKLAEAAGRQIIRLEPDDDGVYVLLWNIYASANRWDEAREMRKMMRNRKIVKRPGCSWIELNVIPSFAMRTTLRGLIWNCEIRKLEYRTI